MRIKAWCRSSCRKLLRAHFARMRGCVFNDWQLALRFVAAMLAMPTIGFGSGNRSNDSPESAICNDTKHRHVVVRSLDRACTKPGAQKGTRSGTRRVLM